RPATPAAFLAGARTPAGSPVVLRTSSSAFATTVTGSVASARITPRAPAWTAAAEMRGSSTPNSTTAAPGAAATIRRVNSTLSGRDSAVSTRIRSALCSANRVSASVTETAVRTAVPTPSRAAQVTTACAATGVRTQTRTVRTVTPLSTQEENTKRSDHSGVPQNSIDDLPSFPSKVILTAWADGG